MFGNKKDLKSTLATVAAFIADIKDGMAENEQEINVLQESIDSIEVKKLTKQNEIDTGRKLLEKLQ